MTMQPSSGETSISAQIPQKVKSSPTRIISRLSVERFWGISSFRSTPKPKPSAIAAMFLIIGMMTTEGSNAPPPIDDIASEIAMLYAISPMTSSNATTCRSVSTNSPFAPVWRIVIIVDAGAVADANAESTSENAVPSPKMQ